MRWLCLDGICMKASACGKIILFGEHSVVYGQPAIAAPVSGLRIYANISKGKGKIYDPPMGEVIDMADRKNPLAMAAWLAMEKAGKAGADFDIRISGDIPPYSGLGSGAAVCVAIMRAVGMWAGREFSPEELAGMSYETEKVFHGNPSGIDNTVVSYEEPVYFVRGKPIEMLRIGKPFTIVIGDTGVKGSTKEMVAHVGKLLKESPDKYNAIMGHMGEIANSAREIIEGDSPAKLGPLMDENQELLRELGVSHKSLERLIAAAKQAGALGAKLAGGGGGGNMIALANDAMPVEAALLNAGAKRVFTTMVGK